VCARFAQHSCFEPAHPWITFKTPAIYAARSSTSACGTQLQSVHRKITLNTSADEIAVCNLGRFKPANHIVDGKLDTRKLAATIKGTAVPHAG